MKFALIGMNIPMLLPTLLTDVLFAGHEAADIAVFEKNGAMADVLQKYMYAVYDKAGIGGMPIVSGDLDEVLDEADCVAFDDDCMPGSRFRMDQEALSGTEGDDQGLSDQARVNGGLGGLLHTLRCGEKALSLCERMRECCPEALVISLVQPVGRICRVFEDAGFRCYGLAPTPLRGANGLEGICHGLHRKADTVNATIAGLPNFEFLLALTDEATGADVLPAVELLAEENTLGRLTRRWLDWYGAIAIGSVPAHAELLAAQPDFIPEQNPSFGETVEQRKERILHMNTVGAHGASDREGMMSQITLLSKASALRPMQLALALLRGTDLTMEAVTRCNNGILPQLPKDAMIEAKLVLQAGQDVTKPLTVPAELGEVLCELAQTDADAAKAVTGDRGAVRAVVEEDPAMGGLDRLYLQDVAEKLIEMHAEVLPRFC